MAGWIVLVRNQGWSLWDPRYAVFIDGKRTARIARGETRDFTVEAGVHRMRVRQLGYPSRTLEVSVADGETVIVRARMRFWASYLTNLFGGLTGGVGFWLFAQGPTRANVIGFSIGVVGFVTLLASRIVFSLRTDPVAR